MTSILDADPYPWDRPEARKLHEELQDAYPDTKAARDMVAVAAGLSAHTIFTEQSTDGFWRDVLNAAAKKGLTRQLAEWARLGLPESAPLYARLTGLLAEVTPEVTSNKIDLSLREVTPRLLLRDVELLFVPGGAFGMGTFERRVGELVSQHHRREFEMEAPRHQVELAPFYVARYPVTNEQYSAFIDDQPGEAVPIPLGDPWSGRYAWDQQTRRPPTDLQDRPVVLVSWLQARRYCRWLGARLPTEAEWEKAARGTDGRAWPWGDEWCDQCCNTAEGGAGEILPVHAHSPEGDSPYGVAGMSGNVWEWCSSLLDPYPYLVDDGREDPGADGIRVIRGGAFEQSSVISRCATRNGANQASRGFTVGFRPAFSPGG